jgi:hypothetical protein
MQKVPGVQSVRVSLNEGLTILDLKRGNTITLANVRDTIKNNGFVSKEAAVVARGQVAIREGRLLFEVAGTREAFVLVAADQARAAYDDLRQRAERAAVENVEITGSVEAGMTQPPRLTLRGFKS